MKACVFTLGCKLNEVESASLMSGLEARGYETTEELGYADLYVLNTCAVTAEAEKKSRQAVARMRKYNPAAPVIVCGCAAERDAERFFRREGVTLVLGAQGKGKLLDLIEEKGVFRETERAFCELPAPKRTRTRAFVRIQDGCDRFCSYCIIPYLRGRSRSRSADAIVKEAETSGAKEIVLTGVDVSSYRDGAVGLGELLLRLSDLPARIRLGSLEAGVVDDAFLKKAVQAKNFVPHFHLSLQSGSDAVLKAMNRRYTRAEFLDCCARIVGCFRDAAITTDIIVGFPTETEQDFEETLSLVSKAGFARVHAFPFSSRPGTVASRMEDLPAAVKKARMERLIAAGKEAEHAYIARFLGREATALFEEEGGYTENYLRVYAEGAREGMLARVRLIDYEKDGVRAEISEVIS